MNTIPKHVAIIMDGNGRWAKSQNKMRSQGHYQGSENVRNVAIAANDLGIKVLTLYAFSTENWKRSDEEVGYLMKLPAVFFKRFLQELMEKDIRICMIGEFQQIPADTAKVLQEAIAQTKQNKGMILNFAMNYGGRREIVLAAKQYAQDCIEGRENDLSEADFGEYMMTHEFPELDLLIRTSDEFRISNFLLWQIAYAELVFVKETWPEFTAETLNDVILQFQSRDRRFGGVKG